MLRRPRKTARSIKKETIKVEKRRNRFILSKLSDKKFVSYLAKPLLSLR